MSIKGLKLLYNFILKDAVKGSGKASGIMSIGSDIRKIAMNKYAKYVDSAKKQGVDLDKLSEQEIKYMLEMNKPKGPTLFGHRVIDATSAEGKGITEALLGKKPADVLDLTGKKIDTSKPILGGKNVPELTHNEKIDWLVKNVSPTAEQTIPPKPALEAMLKDGREDLIDHFFEMHTKKLSGKPKIDIDTSGLKHPDLVKKMMTDEKLKPTLVQDDIVTETITTIKSKKPIDAMAEANSVIGRKGKYKNLTEEQSQKILKDTNDHIFERDIKYDEFGEIIKPDPEDFAHGGRTGTGLNYLLGEDDQNSRVPFAMGKRAFLKWIGSGIAGVGAAKSGLFGLLKGGGKKKVVEEVVKQSAGSGTPPAYFFNLVKKIKNLGDDAAATQDNAVAKKYKDYTMEEDFAGNIEIMKKGDDVAEDVFMSYKVDDVPVKGKKKSTKVEEYEEYTARPDQEGKMKDIEMGVPDSVVEEGTIFEDTISEFTKKASGGRVPLSKGKGVMSLIELITKKFGKDTAKRASQLGKPQKTLDREMFQNFNKKLNPGKDSKSIIPKDEYREYKNDFNKEILNMSPEDQLRDEFPGISDKLIRQILTDKNPQRIAEVKATMREALKMQEKGMGPDQIIDLFKKTPRTKNASGGRVPLAGGGIAGMLGE